MDELGCSPTGSGAAVWWVVGVTPMLGQNDDGRIYDADDARQLVSFARSQGLDLLAFWEMTRDRNACAGPLFRRTNISQQPFEFSRIFTRLPAERGRATSNRTPGGGRG